MRRAILALTVLATVSLTSVAPAAWADHTDPRTPLAPTRGSTADGIERGEGSWTHIANFPGLANPALTGGGTDLEFFSPAGSTDIWGAFGTLGQDEAGSIGQRIIRLTQGGRVLPEWAADHGSAHCAINNTSITGLQHDTQVGQLNGVTLMTDTTDALGRCHDTAGGGIEIVDVSKMQDAVVRTPRGAPRAVRRLLAHEHARHQASLDRLQQRVRLRGAQLDRRHGHAVLLRQEHLDAR